MNFQVFGIPESSKHQLILRRFGTFFILKVTKTPRLHLVLGQLFENGLYVALGYTNRKR